MKKFNKSKFALLLSLFTTIGCFKGNLAKAGNNNSKPLNLSKRIKKQSGKNWLWIVLPLLGIGAGVGVYAGVFFSNRKIEQDEKKENEKLKKNSEVSEYCEVVTKDKDGKIIKREIKKNYIPKEEYLI